MHNGRYREPLENLHKAYRLIGKGQKALERSIGVPICVPNCGICCETTTVSASGIEGRYAAEWVSRQKLGLRDEILKRCEDWLTRDEKYIKLFGGIGTTRLRAEGIDHINMEAAYLTAKTGCPFLNEHKNCLIHPVRPLVCRLYGVTRIPGLICNRPDGKAENRERNIRGLLNVKWCNKIKGAVRLLPMGQPRRLFEQITKKGLETPENGIDLIWNQVFLATLIFLELKPQKFMHLVYDDRIPTAKMMHFGNSQLLWEEQIEEHFDREAEIGFLVNPVPGKIIQGEKEPEVVTV